MECVPRFTQPGRAGTKRVLSGSVSESVSTDGLDYDPDTDTRPPAPMDFGKMVAVFMEVHP